MISTGGPLLYVYVTEIQIRPTRFGAPAARTLVAAALADLSVRYGGGPGDETPVDASEFDPPYGLFLIAYRDGTPIGCAGWRTHGDDVDNIAELKRLYVDPGHRGNGVAKALLTAVEEAARGAGRKRLIIECGDKQPEAIALYETSGYARIPDFGFYQGSPHVRSFGRDL